MDSQTAQAFADFERFLSGLSAPALVGHSLATVVREDVRSVAEVVVRRAYSTPGVDRMRPLLTARNKVFDIFFYRVVRFRRVYDFFPRFERALVEAVPEADRAAVTDLLRRYPWQEIRPLGTMGDPREFALEHRPSASVSSDSFNEDVYRNATHEILSADRRYSFDDLSLRDNVAHYQAQVTEVFDDFVGLIKDAIMRREILLANEADRDVVYKDQPRFQIENYIAQLADLGIAFFNDDFLEHGVQTFGVLRMLAAASSIDLDTFKRLHEKTELFNRQRLAEYASSRTGPILLRSVLPIFPRWRPEALLETVRNDEDALAREFALTLVRAYGRDVYATAVDALERAALSGPPHLQRGLVSLIGHLTTDQAPLRSRAVRALAANLKRESPPQTNGEVVNALASIRTDEATDALGAKLGQIEPEFGKAPDATDLGNRIVNALLEIRSEPSLRTAVRFCDRHGTLESHLDALGRVALPDDVRAGLAAAVRKEMRKLKLSFSLLGDPAAVRPKLLALGSAAQPDVGALCAEIAAAFPPEHELTLAAARLRELPPPSPPPQFDRAFQRLVDARDLPEALSYGFEAGLSGKVEIETPGGIGGDIALRKGDIWHAAVPSLFSKDADAFNWLFALEPATIAAARFAPTPPPGDARTLDAPTPELIREGLFRAKHVQQTIASILSPESRFRRRQPEFPDSGFETTGQLGPFKAVWVCLVRPVDIKTISSATGLSEHEIYRVLFDLLRQNLLDVETGTADRQLATIDDAMTALGLFLRRISAHPTYFHSYQSAAEVCAYLSNEASDETVRSASWALHTYLLNAFTLRRVLAPQNVDFCEKTLTLVSTYVTSRTDDDRKDLLEFLDIYLPEEDRWPAPAQDEDAFIQSILEQIENIDAVNDPFDAVVEGGGAPSAEVVERTLDDALTAQASGDGAVEIRSPRELVADAAVAFVKPLRDFVREVERDMAAHRETSSDWLRQAGPPLETLVAIAERADDNEVREAAFRLERAFRQQRQTGSEVLTPAFCGYVLTEYRHLVELMPSAFSVDVPPEDLELRRRSLFVKFLLRQVPEIDELSANKVLAAGFNTLEELAETRPDDLARGAGIPRKLAEKIFMKVYQYEDLYFHGDEPQAHAKLLAFYAINLNVLKEIQGSIDRLAPLGDEARERKEKLLVDRQRALWGLFSLLCLRNGLDLIERLQKMVFEQRIAALEQYFSELSAEPFPTGRRRRA